MEALPKCVPLLLVSDRPIHMERLGIVWYVLEDGQCVYMLDGWTQDGHEPTLMVRLLCARERIDPSRTSFVELCSWRAYKELAPDEVAYRWLDVACDPEYPAGCVVTGYAMGGTCGENIRAAFRRLFCRFLGVKDAPDEKVDGPALAFSEVAYANPFSTGPDDDAASALYAVLDRGTCVFAKVGGGRYHWEEASRIAEAILGLESLDPEGTLFYDATLGMRCWQRVTVKWHLNDYRFHAEGGICPDANITALMEEEVRSWQDYTAHKQ